MDFSSLLKGLAQKHTDAIANSPWADLAVGKRRPNAPPAIVLTPAQQAMSDIHDGATEAASVDAPPMDTATPAATSGFAGLMGGKGMQGLQGALRNATESTPTAIAPITMEAPMPTPQYTYQPIQMRAQGGAYDPNQPVIVGENGPEEIVNNTVYPLTDTPQQIAQRNTTPVEAAPVGMTGLATQAQPQEQMVTSGAPVTSTTGADVPPTTAQMPVATQSPQMPVATQPATRPMSADEEINAAKDAADLRALHAMQAQPEKGSKWKNIGVGLATSAYNATHPQDIQQVKSWNDIKKDREVAKAQGDAAKIAAIQTARTADARAKATADYTLNRLPVAKEIATIKDAGLTARATDRDLLNIYKGNTTFDPTDPDNAELVAAVKNRLNVTLPAKNGKTKTDLRFDEKTGEAYTFSRDDAGNVEIHKALDDDGQPVKMTTKGMVTSEDKARQRELQSEIAKQRNITAVRVADIGAGSRKDVANINQAGATGRNEAKIKSTEQLTTEKLNAQTQYHQDVQKLGPLKADASHLAGFIHAYMTLHGEKPSQALQDEYLNGLKSAVTNPAVGLGAPVKP